MTTHCKLHLRRKETLASARVLVTAGRTVPVLVPLCMGCAVQRRARLAQKDPLVQFRAHRDLQGSHIGGHIVYFYNVSTRKWPLHLAELDLSINTGLRKGSQYSLTWDMVDFRGRMLNIPRTKNEEPLHVPLNDAAVAALRVVHDRCTTRGRVFQSAKTGEPLENGRHWFDDALMEAGIKNFRWHDLRHTFASRLRMKGAPLEDIADLLGHKSLTMTRRYAHLGPNKLHAVVSLLGATATKAAHR
jgi:Phage integrase family